MRAPTDLLDALMARRFVRRELDALPRRAAEPATPAPVTPVPATAPLAFRRFREEQQRVARRLAGIGGATR